MTYATLREANEALAERSKRLHEIFAEAGPDMDLRKVKSLPGDTGAKAGEIKRLNDELSAIGVERDGLRALDQARLSAEAEYRAQHEPAGGIIHPRDGEHRRQEETRSIGQIFVASAQYQEYKGLRNWPKPASIDLDIRAAVFRTGAGWSPETIRIPRTELSPQRPIAVVDAIPMLPTGESSIAYMEETTFTNTAAEAAESTSTAASDLIGESALALTERTRPVEWIPVFVPVTMQQMEDVEGIEEYINSRLRYMLRARLDLQLLVGDGNTPNLLGTNNVSNINTQAKGTDPVFDAIFKAIQLVRGQGATPGFAEPSAIFLHPADWTDIRLTRTADGIYIIGSPTDPGPERLWGVPVIVTPAATQNTATLGDYADFSALYTKRGITISVSDSHAHYFTRGMLAIRADMRVSMVHFRPRAFATVTGI